jgi:hypothetical protein
MSLLDRLRKNFDIGTRGCWLWTGPVDSWGYGRISFNGKNATVHRLAAWLLMDFSLDSELQVCHKCDVPNCFNPDHLFFGTQYDNTWDAVNKGRLVFGEYNKNKKKCKRGHPFNEKNTRRGPNGRRTCRVCFRDLMRLYRRAS